MKKKTRMVTKYTKRDPEPKPLKQGAPKGQGQTK